nr:amino acid adenylation domain-containing protein [Brenneria tiliae]
MHVSALTGMAQNELPLNLSLFELGMDSIGLMRTVNLMRKHGFPCTFESLKNQPTLAQWLALTETNGNSSSETVIPDVSFEHSSELTPMQQAYWLGRQDDQPLGGVSCQVYIELQGNDINAARLSTACKQLVSRHPMLRARFTAQGEQYIALTASPEPLRVHDWRDLTSRQVEQQLQQLREHFSHYRADVEHGAALKVQLVQLPDHQSRLHFNLDLLVADVLSISLILRDLAAFYHGEGDKLPALNIHFFQYQQIMQQQAAEQRHTAQAYWQQRLAVLPGGPQLPLAQQPERLSKPRFMRRQYLLKNNQLARLQQRTQQHGITLSTLFLTLYCEVLVRWSATTHFLINVPLFNRRELESSVQHMVADFTTLLLLEVDFRQPATFDCRLQAIQRQLHRDIDHADYSGVEVLRDMARLDGESLRTSPVVFACNLVDLFIPPEAERAFGTLYWMISQTPQVWIDHQSYPTKDGLLLNWDSVDALFPPGMMDDMFSTWNDMLLRVIEQPWDQQLTPTLPAHMLAIREQVNATAVSREPAVLHQAFFRQAELNPSATALITQRQAIRYRELADQALVIAGQLQHMGVSPQQVVAINLPRGIEQIAAVLGVLAAGAVWLPLSIRHPLARRAAICQQAGAVCVIGLQRETWPDATRQLLVHETSPVPALTTPKPVIPTQLAYIIYTSGSSGAPKGVAISHRAAWNTINALNHRFAIGPEDRVLALSGLEFDLSVYDLFGLLAVGGSLVLITEEQRRDPDAWIAMAQYGKVTLWNSVPSLLEMLLLTETEQPLLPYLRLAWVSGDRVAPDLAARLRQRVNHPLRVIAMGGATEAAIWSNSFEITEDFNPHTVVPYGYPLENQCFRVMDAQQRDCPDWVPGELWIGGSGLAQGYYGALELTERQFVMHEGGRWYRTGDRGYYQSNGLLQFIGRQDQQVKIDGYRIELAEIESALQCLPGVKSAICLVGKRQNAHCIEAVLNGVQPLNNDRILEQLAEKLPPYMLPQRIFLIEAFPLTSNGKIDRCALTEWLHRQLVPFDKQHDPTESQLTERLRTLWLEVLGQQNIGANQSFFQLGGNSLQAVRLVNRINQVFGLQLTMRHFLRHSTLSALSSSIEKNHPHLMAAEEGSL